MIGGGEDAQRPELRSIIMELKAMLLVSSAIPCEIDIRDDATPLTNKKVQYPYTHNIASFIFSVQLSLSLYIRNYYSYNITVYIIFSHSHPHTLSPRLTMY